MKFPSVLTLDDYSTLLRSSGCEVCCAQDTGRFPLCVPLYLDMIEKQLTYDALKIIGFDQALAGALIGEMRFLQALAEGRRIIRETAGSGRSET